MPRGVYERTPKIRENIRHARLRHFRGLRARGEVTKPDPAQILRQKMAARPEPLMEWQDLTGEYYRLLANGMILRRCSNSWLPDDCIAFGQPVKTFMVNLLGQSYRHHIAIVPKIRRVLMQQHPHRISRSTELRLE